MKNIGKIRSLTVLIIVAVFAACLGVYYFISNETSRYTDKTLSARKVIRAAEAARAQSKDIQALYDKSVEARKGITNFFIPSDSAVTALQTIESVGSTSNAVVTISSPKEVLPDGKSGDPTGRISADVSVTGTWKDVIKAFQLFETLPYETTIDNVSFTSSNISKSDSEMMKRWQVSFKISIMTLDKNMFKNASTTKSK